MTINKRNLPALFGRDEFLTPFDKLFDDFAKIAWPNFGDEFGLTFFENSARPRIDAIDYEDKIQIKADIGGLKKEDVELNVQDGILTIKCNKSNVYETTEKKKYLYKEISSAKFSRSFTLGDNLDSKKISADFKDGILTIDIPKIKPDTSNNNYKIEIK